MLIRKSLYGNLRPTPGDLYDPRDGSCLPNFHLSTTHNPNLLHVTQDLVKYDIQLVHEIPSSNRHGHSTIGPNNPRTESLSLMLLAVAEYSEGLDAGTIATQPFVIHKVFYREAVAGLLHLRHKVENKDITLLQSILRKCIPNPENFKSQLLQQFNMAISKVSIIQHGQEYHYTNIKMAFIEISKIINQVCSAQNLNARSILVEIPSVLPYNILDKNKYLAYLHEKQMRMRQKEEERRQYLLQVQYQQKMRALNNEERQQHSYGLYSNTHGPANQHGKLIEHHSYSSEQSYTTEYSNQQQPIGAGYSSEGSHLLNQSSQRSVATNTTAQSFPHYIGVQEHSDVPHHRRFLKYAIETTITTKNGKKIVTYHDTGESFIYKDVHTLPIREETFEYDLTNLDPHKSFTKSTPNLAAIDNELNSRPEEYSRDGRYGHFDSAVAVSFGSYLRERSHSVDNLNTRDKIDRYPSLLIEPGRKLVRGHDPKQEPIDKWKMKSPFYRKSSHSLSGHLALHEEHSDSNTAQQDTQRLLPPRPASAGGCDTLLFTAGVTDSRGNQHSGDLRSYQQQQQQPRQHIELQQQHIHLKQQHEVGHLQQDHQQLIHYIEPGQKYHDTSSSSFLLDSSTCSTPDQTGTHVVDRDFVYKAYPVNVRAVR